MSSDQDNQTSSIIGTIDNQKRLTFIVTFVILIILIAGITVSTIFEFRYLTLTLILFVTGLIIYFVVLIRNILTSLRYEINELNITLDKKSRSVSTFSHLIRTPLNNFSLIIALFDNTGLNNRQKELLETLTASTNNMVSVVNELSMQTAREIGFEHRKKIKLDLTSTLQNTIDLYDFKTDTGTSVKIIPSAELKHKYLGDPVVLKQIFLDLFNTMELHNVEDLQVEIGISVEKPGRDKDEVRFTFKTNRQIELLHMHKDPSDVIDDLSAKLISRLGGKYSSSISDDGAVFIFDLPMTRVENEPRTTDVAERIRELNMNSKVTKNLSEANILLVEDNPTNQKIVLISLQNRVKSIDTAANGKEALDMFGKSNYDLILMDVQLPIMDGLTSVQKIRELESSTSKHTPIIAITANAMIGDKEKCLSAGMDEYLSKPFQPNQLISLIEKLISG